MSFQKQVRNWNLLPTHIRVDSDTEMFKVSLNTISFPGVIKVNGNNWIIVFYFNILGAQLCKQLINSLCCSCTNTVTTCCHQVHCMLPLLHCIPPPGTLNCMPMQGALLANAGCTACQCRVQCAALCTAGYQVRCAALPCPVHYMPPAALPCTPLLLDWRSLI